MTRIKKIWITAAAFIVCTCAAAVVSGFSGGGTSYTAPLASAQSFFSSSGIEITPESSVPSGLGVDTGRKGILMASAAQGAEAAIDLNISGSFEIDFRVFSEQAFPKTGGWNTAGYTNPYLDLTEISLNFRETGGNGKSFTLIVAGGEGYASATPSARVKIDSVTAGYSYDNNTISWQDSSTLNANGYYTRLYGTTFCNNAVLRSGTWLPDGGASTVIGFDPSNMTLYGYNYTSASVKTKRIIADFNDARLIGRNTLDSFGEYRVTISMSKINPGRAGRMIIYSLNGQNLDTAELVKSIGPTTFVAPRYNAQTYMPYTLPSPDFTFDLVEGKSSAFNGFVRIAPPGGSVSVIPWAGADTAFTPVQTGTYKLTYTAEDGGGLAGPGKEIEIQAVQRPADPGLNIARSALLSEAVVIGKDTALTFPSAAGASAVAVSEKWAYLPAVLTIEGQTYDASSAARHTFDTVGIFTAVYSTTDIYGKTTQKSYTVTVENAPVFSGVTLRPDYEYGSAFTVPENTAALGAANYPVTHKIIRPDGQVITGGTAALDLQGYYTLIYSCVYGGKAYVSRYEFFVRMPVSQAFSPLGSATVTSDAAAPDYMPQAYNGVLITASKSGGGAVLNAPVNVGDMTKDDTLIELIVVPVRPQIEMTQVVITLTDIENPGIWLKISLYRDSWNYLYITRVSVASSSYSRFVSTQYGKAGYYDNAINGTEIWHTFWGITQDRSQPMKLHFDASENALYASPYTSGGSKLVMDLDNPASVGKGREWRGFPSGFAAMKIEMNGLSATAARLMVLNVAGNDLDGEFIANKLKAPYLSVDLGAHYDGEIPKAETGRRYPVFAATGYAVFQGVLSASADVYFGGSLYAADTAYFIPHVPGFYQIVYTVKDCWGNVSRQTVQVEAVAALPPVTVGFAGNAPVPSAYTGQRVAIPEPVLTGGSGALLYETYILSGMRAEAAGRFFRPEAPGTYTVLYVVSDYYGSRWFTYDIAVTDDPNPEPRYPVMPEALMNGRPFVFGALETGDTQINVGYKGADIQLAADRAYTPAVAAHGDTVTVTYRQLEGGAEVWRKAFTVPVVKPAAIGQYFYTENLNWAYGNVSSTLTVTPGQSEAAFGFVNRLYAAGLSLTLKVLQGGFTNFDVWLRDTRDSGQEVKISYINKGGRTYISVNDGALEDYEQGFSGREFTLGYNERGALTDGEGSYIPFADYMNGAKFEGFGSGWVYLRAEIEGVTAASAVELVRLGNQTFVDTDRDMVMPQVYLNGLFSGAADFGMSFMIPAAIAHDILSETVTLTLAVTAPDRTVLHNGAADRELFFTANQYGRYRVEYTAVDGNGRRIVVNYAVEVLDRIPPVIWLSGGVPETAAAGKKITLPSATATDNEAAAPWLFIFVIDSDGRYFAVSGDAFTFPAAGTYTVRYYAEDAAGNTTIRNFTITVS